MSGITPILDTLLHQVLGKRVDVPLVRDFPEPVRPTSPGEAVQPARSDSRLDPRAPLPQAAAAQGGGARAGAPPAAAPPVPAENTSTLTHFSGAARTIADLLQRYPAPPSAVRPPAPLLPVPARDGAQLAQRLQGSIENSGLFYESHLRNRLSGGGNLQSLAREPQMRLTQAPPAAEVPVNMPEKVPAGSSQPRRLPLDSGAADALQGLLRHQLELLATPVLRWEGEIWSGIFAALVLQPPEQRPARDRDAPDGDGERADAEERWQTQLQLQLPGLGEIHAQLGLYGERLALTLSAPEAAAVRLEAAAGTLRERLRDRGLGELSLTVEPLA